MLDRTNETTWKRDPMTPIPRDTTFREHPSDTEGRMVATKGAALLWDFERKEWVGRGQTTLGIGFDDTLLTATTLTEESRRIQGMFAKSRFDRPTDYKIRMYGRGRLLSETCVEREELVVSFVQPTKEGFLLVGSRYFWTPAGPEKNAAVYDWNGKLRPLCFSRSGVLRHE